MARDVFLSPHLLSKNKGRVYASDGSVTFEKFHSRLTHKSNLRRKRAQGYAPDAAGIFRHRVSSVREYAHLHRARGADAKRDGAVGVNLRRHKGRRVVPGRVIGIHGPMRSRILGSQQSGQTDPQHELPYSGNCFAHDRDPVYCMEDVLSCYQAREYGS